MHDMSIATTSPPGLGETRAAAVAEELRRLILSGELPPGTHLRQVELAERFRVSTTPVREAHGLVRHDVQKGVVVFQPTDADVLENYEIRGALEPLATELAARAVTDAELAVLDGVVERMRAAGDRLAYVALNREFHRAIYAAARRPRLLELIESLRDAFDAYVLYDAAAHPDPAYFDRAHAEHEAIAAALHAHDPERARALMETHLALNAEHFRASIARDYRPASARSRSQAPSASAVSGRDR
jgi:DNA-binding GntR family transcriptional regulator